MSRRPISLTPTEARVLSRCPLHYHFLQQGSSEQEQERPQATLDKIVRESIQHLHAAGGPARCSLESCLKEVAQPAARKMIENYYYRLEQDWSRIIAGNEPMSLRISIGGISLVLKATLDRLDKTSDGGILAVLIRTDWKAPSTADDLRTDPVVTIYHALVASTYPLKRPVRIQELWLYHNQEVTVELSEAEYRENLGHLREPVQALARGEVMARPGLHCDVCSFKYRGCPVYAQGDEVDSQSDDFVPPTSDGKIPSRKWIFKI